MKLTAQVISWVFMPLLMPIYALLLVMFVPSNQDYFFNEDCLYTLPIQSKWAVLYVFGIFGVLAPGLSFIFLWRYKVINSMEMETGKERSVPIIVMLLYCLVLYFFMLKSNSTGLSKFIYALPLSGVGVTAIYYLLNKWKKISIHAGAVGIATGFILAYILQHVEYQLWTFILMILISGLVMSARMYLEKHTLFEIVIGWLTGSLITFAVNYYY